MFYKKNLNCCGTFLNLRVTVKVLLFFFFFFFLVCCNEEQNYNVFFWELRDCLKYDAVRLRVICPKGCPVIIFDQDMAADIMQKVCVSNEIWRTELSAVRCLSRWPQMTYLRVKAEEGSSASLCQVCVSINTGMTRQSIIKLYQYS